MNTTPIVQLTKVERINFESDAPMASTGPERHVVNELVCPLRGEYAVLLADGSRHQAGPGSVFIYPAGLAHRGMWGPVSGGGRSVTDFFLVWWRGPMPDPCPPVHTHVQPERLRSCCGWMLDSFATGRPDGVRVAELLLQALLLAVAEGGQERAELLQVVDAVIDQTRDRRLRLAHLADAVGLSRFHFTRRFKELTGRSPMAYARDRRLAAVYRDLVDGDEAIAVIARRHQFATPQQLSTQFRQRYGVSPRQVRREHGYG